MRSRIRPRTTLCIAAAYLLTAWVAGAEPNSKATPAWCTEGMEVIDDGMCYFTPATRNENGTPADNGSGQPDARAESAKEEATSFPRASDTLIIFLHSLVKMDSNWQWEQQRLVTRNAAQFGVSVLMPRGRPGIGPGRTPEVLAWPTAQSMQEDFEDELIGEWQSARRKIERRRGRPFEHIWIFGFSNGAYYATSMAMRGRLNADGYGVFAGGQGGKYASLLGSKTSRRPAIFVGYGTKDPAKRHMQSLVKTLRALSWPSRSMTEKVGHIVTDAQLREAMRYLIEQQEARHR